MKTANKNIVSQEIRHELAEIERQLPPMHEWGYAEPVSRLIMMIQTLVADRDAARAERDKLVRLRQELVQVIDHVPGDVWIKAISAAGYGPHCPEPAKERTTPC